MLSFESSKIGVCILAAMNSLTEREREHGVWSFESSKNGVCILADMNSLNMVIFHYVLICQMIEIYFAGKELDFQLSGVLFAAKITLNGVF